MKYVIFRPLVLCSSVRQELEDGLMICKSILNILLGYLSLLGRSIQDCIFTTDL